MRFPWQKDNPQLKYKINTYPDGSKYVEILDWGSNLTYRINSYEDLWLLGQINDALENTARKVNVFIPCLLDAQADRRFENNQPASLKMVCKFLNNMKGFHSITIFHPHNPEVVEALIDNVKIDDNNFFIRYVLQDLVTTMTDLESNLILMSSDAGGFKPLMKLCDKLEWRGETYSASKSRKYEEGKSKLTTVVDRTDFGGKDILIIDDICVYGNTFVQLAELLKEKNCGKLYLAVSHITVQEPSYRLWEEFDKVYTTDSKGLRYINQYQDRPDNLKVITL